MLKPKIYADFNNADAKGRLRLNCVGTASDLALQKVELRDGLKLHLYSDDLDNNGQLDELLVEGIVSFSEEEHCWVAVIDWDAIHHSSDIRGNRVGGGDPTFPTLSPGGPPSTSVSA